MTDDLTLLRSYAANGAEEAFRTVVERNASLVFASAMRQVGDPHLAQEVTQAVFLILARKAGSLNPATVLVGWLFRTTRYAAAQALRAARRRQRYEQEAAQMLPTTTAPAAEATWVEIAPFLDEAIADLGATDRHAILLRFFERKEMKDIGGALGATEDAAKKRVSRALEKIRSFLARRGVVLSVAGLATLLTANAMPAIPPAILSSITATLAGANLATSTTLVTLTMKAMFQAKLRIAAAIAALFLVAGGAGTYIAVLSATSTPAPNTRQAVTPTPQPQPIPAPTPTTSPKPSGLVWDLEQKEYKAGAGEGTASFSFNFTNTSSGEIVINRVQPSCGCTTTRDLPALPWRVPAAASAHIDLVMNLTGKSGTVTKTVLVDTSDGTKSLVMRVEIPANAAATNGAFTVRTEAQRAANMQLAGSDRQAIFKGDCAKCHVTPTVGKVGHELYAAACGICHDAEHRASMVPDLRILPHPTNAEFWKAMIAFGKPGTLMPAFAKSQGGNLDDTQIDSLVGYLVATIPGRAVAGR